MYKLGEQAREVDYECEVDSTLIRDRMKRTLFKCMRSYPFYGTIAIGLRLQEVPADSWIKTAAVDGVNLFYNKHFINALDNEELLFLYAHEVLHVVLKHFTRKGNRDAKIWNSAGDFIINRMLVEAGVGKFPSIGGLYNDKYNNMTTEAVYEIIYDTNPPSNFDQHFDVTISENGEGDGEGNPSSGNGINISEEMAEQISQEVDAKIIQAMNNANSSNTAGQVPLGIRRMVEDLTTPVVPWRRFISSNASSQVKSDYTWAKPNRRYMALGVIIPSIKTEKHFEFTVGIDTSGSISTTMLKDFVGELFFISRSFRSFKIQVFQYDTKVYGFKEFDQNNIHEMLEYEIKGGGGTCYNAAYDYFKKHNIKPKTYINMTDGYPCSGWGDEDYCRSIFLIHEQSAIDSKIKSPFGMTLYYNDFDKT